MAHYSDVENRYSKEELKKLKEHLKQKISMMNKAEAEFLHEVVESIEDYKKFFELLKKLI